jgi:hypothetical protein
MWKALSILGALTVAGVILTAQPAAAQQPSAKDIKKLQADIDKLRVQLDEIAARLDKMTGGTTKPQAKDTPGYGYGGPWGRGGWGGKWDPEQMKKWMESYGKGPDRTPAESSKSDLERRLDRVLDQLEELRRDLKKK